MNNTLNKIKTFMAIKKTEVVKDEILVTVTYTTSKQFNSVEEAYAFAGEVGGQVNIG